MQESDANPRLRVLWVSHLVPYPPRAGVLSRSYNLLKEVSAYHEVHLTGFVQSAWLRTFFPSVESGLEEATSILGSYCRVHDWLPIESEQHGRPGRWSLAFQSLLSDPCYSVRWLSSTSMHTALRRLASQHVFDLVHFDTISLAQYRAHFPRSAASLGHHNVESHMLERRARQEKSLLGRAYFRQEALRLAAYEQAVAADFDIHITCAELDSQRLLAVAPGARATAVPNGVDVNYFSRSSRSVVEHDLVFVGTMDWYPNVSAVEFFLEEVWARLVRWRPGTTFGIVGSNPSPGLVERARREQGVTVHGYVDDVRPYLQGARAFICPIRDGGGTKLKILDALAMECCVIAHPIACEGIAVENGRHLALADSADSLVETIVRLLDDEPERRRLGHAGRELMVSSYAYPALGRQLAAAWNVACEARSKAS